jgi:iron complex outermembrane recepter protein
MANLELASRCSLATEAGITVGSEMKLEVAFACGIALLFAAENTMGQTAVAPDNSASTTGGLEEIVVTAQRRQENLQSVPIAVTAITGQQLQNSQIESTQDLAVVTPGLTFPSDFLIALPHLRGVGSTVVAAGVENSVATYVDGVYYAAPTSSIFNLNNVSQIEVLKGPQGTLFGRNATGGLIQVITKDPTQEVHGQANLSYGNYNTTQLEAYLTGGISSTLAADIALEASHQGSGWGRNYFNGEDTYKMDQNIAARSKWLWTPANGTRVTLSMDYENTRNSIGVAQAQGTAATNPFYPASVIAVPPYNYNENIQPLNTHEGGGASIRVEQDVGFADLVNITAYRQESDYYSVDFDLGPAQIVDDLTSQVDSQISEELQLRSHASDIFTWTTGLFYFHSRDAYDPLIIGFGGPAATPVGPGLFLTDVIIDSTQHTDSIAGYAQGTYTIAPGWHFTAGGRFTHEKKSFDADQDGLINNTIPIPLVTGIDESFSVNKPSWRAALDHNFTDDVMGYVSFNSSFKSGGYNTGAPTEGEYQTEELDAYELGLKTEFLNHRLRLNTAAFYYKYSNIQVSRFVNGTPAIYNGAAAKLYGLDVDMEAVVTDALTISAGAEYLHTYFNDFPCADYFVGGPQPSSPACSASAVPTLPYDRSAKGNRLPDAPDFTSTLTVDYHLPLFGGVGHVTVTDGYDSGYFYEPNNGSAVQQHAFNVLNGSATWTTTDERYLFRLWARNMADRRYTVELATAATGVAESFAPPRTYGVEVGVKF